MRTYSTSQGDVYDLISFKVYGDAGFGDVIAAANPAYMDTVVFNADVILTIPDMPAVAAPSSAAMPPWRVAEPTAPTTGTGRRGPRGEPGPPGPPGPPGKDGVGANPLDAISTDPNNHLSVGTDNKLFVAPCITIGHGAAAAGQTIFLVHV